MIPSLMSPPPQGNQTSYPGASIKSPICSNVGSLTLKTKTKTRKLQIEKAVEVNLLEVTKVGYEGGAEHGGDAGRGREERCGQLKWENKMESTRR